MNVGGRIFNESSCVICHTKWESDYRKRKTKSEQNKNRTLLHNFCTHFGLEDPTKLSEWNSNQDDEGPFCSSCRQIAETLTQLKNQLTSIQNSIRNGDNGVKKQIVESCNLPGKITDKRVKIIQDLIVGPILCLPRLESSQKEVNDDSPIEIENLQESPMDMSEHSSESEIAIKSEPSSPLSSCDDDFDPLDLNTSDIQGKQFDSSDEQEDDFYDDDYSGDYKPNQSKTKVKIKKNNVNNSCTTRKKKLKIDDDDFSTTSHISTLSLKQFSTGDDEDSQPPSKRRAAMKRKFIPSDDDYDQDDIQDDDSDDYKPSQSRKKVKVQKKSKQTNDVKNGSTGKKIPKINDADITTTTTLQMPTRSPQAELSDVDYEEEADNIKDADISPDYEPPREKKSSTKKTRKGEDGLIIAKNVKLVKKPYRPTVRVKGEKNTCLYADYKFIGTDKDKYRCPLCPKVSFKNRGAATYHIRHIHLKEQKPYLCDTCGLSFGKADTLAHHVSTHHQPVLCHLCGGSYGSQVLLKNHLAFIHYRPEFHCQLENCNETFSFKRNYLQHVRSRHKNVPREELPSSIQFCPFCPCSFVRKTRMAAHIQKFHGEPAPIIDNVKVVQGPINIKPKPVKEEGTREIRRRNRKSLPLLEFYQCSICGSKFSSRKNVSSHKMKYHKAIHKSRSKKKDMTEKT